MAAFTTEHLTFTYPLAETSALRDVSLTVEEGELLVLCGPSGGGKTTLLRQLKPALTPHGRREGAVTLFGVPAETLSERDAAARVGVVLQEPEDQIVTDRVWHELAFAAEQLGVEEAQMRLRVGELAGFFGIDEWFSRDTDTLSGGEKQLLALASALVTHPDLLLLDEPTAQLDPVSAERFLSAVRRVNRELGVTVVLSAHRLDDVLSLADRVCVLENGAVAALGTTEAVARKLYEKNDPFYAAMPAPVRLWAETGMRGACPADVRGGRALLRTLKPDPAAVPAQEKAPAGEAVLTGKGLWFRYEKNAPDVLRGLDITVRRGEIFAILGGNGSGKSTLLHVLSGTRRAYRGRIGAQGVKTALLPQDTRALFWHDTVAQELDEAARMAGASRERLEELSDALGIIPLLQRDGADLSGGERQRAAMAKVLLTEPDVLLLDEPTRGMDAPSSLALGAMLRKIAATGTAVVLVSHDAAFCARFSDRAALLFDGALTGEQDARAFFAGNHFYTTAANRMARFCLPQAVLTEEVLCACAKT